MKTYEISDMDDDFGTYFYTEEELIDYANELYENNGYTETEAHTINDAILFLENKMRITVKEVTR